MEEYLISFNWLLIVLCNSIAVGFGLSVGVFLFVGAAKILESLTKLKFK